ANDSDEAAQKDSPSEEEALPRVEGANQVNEDDDDERDDIEADAPGGDDSVEERDEEDVHGLRLSLRYQNCARPCI
ncbi:hypothetical protein OC845_002771, partial [Tilletia horrida]